MRDRMLNIAQNHAFVTEMKVVVVLSCQDAIPLNIEAVAGDLSSMFIWSHHTLIHSLTHTHIENGTSDKHIETLHRTKLFTKKKNK